MRGRWYCIDGNMYESVVDLRVPCPNTDLVFRRVYGSWSMDAGTLGYGWTHGYEWRLSVSNGSDRVVVRSAGEGIDNLLAVKIGGESYYPLTDIQGTVWGYADSQNNVIARWTYDAWGNVLSETCTVPALAFVRYRFQGREWSASTGLINFRMRWYYSNTGRWLSKDPIGLSAGLNLYVYCGNRPVLYVDPQGLMFMVSVNPDPEKWGFPRSTHQDGNEDTRCGKNPFTTITLPRLLAPSGNGYQGDPFGHGTKPGTQVPKDAHIHQYPHRGPKRIFNLDGTPRDDGPKLPKRDIPVFERVVNQVMRAIRGLRLPLPAMVTPPQPVELPDGRLGT